MKIIYYVTDHGLGHSSRSVAIIRELEKQKINVIIRNNDIHSFFKKSLPKIRVVNGKTDFSSIMNTQNNMKMDYRKTQKSITEWLQQLPYTIQRESSFIQKEKPDLIVTDISIMPLFVQKTFSVKTIAISNFLWNEVLYLNTKTKNIFMKAYESADYTFRLSFGSNMDVTNKKNVGLVARKVNKSREEIRKKIGLDNNQKLVLLSISNLSKKITMKKENNIVFLDISDYSEVAKLKNKINLLEGQNLVNASDLVICKCGYGFISECLTNGTKFRYILEPTHIEANAIHKNLLDIGLENEITINQIRNTCIDDDFIKNTKSHCVKNNVEKVTKRIISVVKSS